MSYEEFRRRIDTARQILVGAVPSPAGQIDQITYALMYKFMNDIDDQAAALGGKRTYFTGDYAKYNWHELMKPGLEAHDQLELYRQAIQGMSKNPGLPSLFREIYQNAFLPFNSPNVLRLFLEEINKFNHGDSDDIGDAYEYLLSITGAQGDVGQFRTPRHIIKFIVEAVNPSKDDTVLDPAVGTAGFLIAAYNHVKSQHDGKDGQGNTNDERRLTADELEKLHHNYRGFDIDPTMVRTASVNMYLHGFTSPDIRNHDSLSSEDYWNDRYDVILANPPFMTPKGGIQPHKKFSISANRAEVLFVDYIASHLKPTGRAGVIVPEGIIFQSGKAYKELRKNLVENYLYAVVSLPAGVFQPYSGVKTSVLLMDKQLAKERDEILFVKVENDGYTLGAQRRRDRLHDQLPSAIDAINLYKTNYHQDTPFSHTVSRKKIAESDDYNLSGDRYTISSTDNMGDYPLTTLGEITDFIRGVTFSRKDHVDNANEPHVLVATTKAAQADGVHYEDLVKASPAIIKKESVMLQNGDFLISVANSANLLGRKTFVKTVPPGDKLTFGAFMGCLRPKKNLVIPEYLNPFLESDEYKKFCLSRANTTTNISNLNWGDLSQFKIPLPPIEIQREIVAELDGYQKIIDAAQTIVKTYKPTIKINPEWERASLEDITTLIQRGKSPKYGDSEITVIKSGQARGYYEFDFSKRYTTAHDFSIDHRRLMNGDLLINSTGVGTAGRITLFRTNDANPYLVDSHITIVRVDEAKAVSDYVLYALAGTYGFDGIEKMASGSGGQIELGLATIRGMSILLPPVETQREIVAQLEAEQQLVDANKKLIEIYQQKIKSKLAEIWGE